MRPDIEEDRRAKLRVFLIAQRARLTPRDVALPDTGRRRVAGLRREEGAELAGVSDARDALCTAAPIRDQVTHSVTGVIDVTGNYRLFHAEMTSMSQAAREIEEGVAETYERGRA